MPQVQGFSQTVFSMFFLLMECVKLVKVELQKISIYLCCNTWIQSHQLHVITTCSVWGQACKQETWKQKLMQGSSREASCPAFGMQSCCPALQSGHRPDLHNSKSAPQHGLEQLYLGLSCCWGIIQVMKQRQQSWIRDSKRAKLILAVQNSKGRQQS